jgi:hypothetical protein
LCFEVSIERITLPAFDAVNVVEFPDLIKKHLIPGEYQSHFCDMCTDPKPRVIQCVINITET